MQFEYEISPNEYAASQAAYHKLTRGRRRIQYALFWIVVGMFFIFVAWSRQTLDWAPVLLVAAGIYWLYCGLANLFIETYFRRSYAKSGIKGKRFHADVGDQGFEVTGESCTWHVPWAGVSVKSEEKGVFMLYAAGTVFMFGKKYMSDEQQRELCRLTGLDSDRKSPA